MNIRLARPLCGDGVDQRAAAAVFTPTQPPRARQRALLLCHKVKKIYIECKCKFNEAEIGEYNFVAAFTLPGSNRKLTF